MEVYRRITEKVRGALWAHHRRLMPERQFHRILAYVYNNKYEYQLRFDKMEVVGTEWNGKVEVVITPSGYLKRVRVHPSVEDLPSYRQKQLLLSAYAKAYHEGHKLLAEAETQVYRQFLLDLKPIVMGIRDNPEFFTMPEDAIETVGGVLARGGSSKVVKHRTIPAAKAMEPADEVQLRHQAEKLWVEASPRWAHSLRGKDYLSRYAVEARPKGAPGPKTRQLPLTLRAPYSHMDEDRLRRRNWMAYLDNKHVAETLWTRSRIGGREKTLRKKQERGEAWHRPMQGS